MYADVYDACAANLFADAAVLQIEHMRMMNPSGSMPPMSSQGPMPAMSSQEPMPMMPQQSQMPPQGYGPPKLWTAIATTFL